MQIRRAVFGFCLAVSLEWTMVNPHPLGLESRGLVGIHERQPGYLPSYNGIFSIHALNFTASTSDTPQLQHLAANDSLSAADQEETDDRFVSSDDEETNLFSEDGTSANEVDSKEIPKVPELTTFPQLHVVTQTIGDPTTADWVQTDKETESETTAAENETTTEVDHTGSETLLEGAQDAEDPSQDSEDIFDRLMRTIQGHWLDFVGKMKLSVLDVWKSISHHMMERLETFATGI